MSATRNMGTPMSSNGIKGFCRKENSEAVAVGVGVNVDDGETDGCPKATFEIWQMTRNAVANANA